VQNATGTDQQIDLQPSGDQSLPVASPCASLNHIAPAVLNLTFKFVTAA
jgi:hypothetical protein